MFSGEHFIWLGICAAVVFGLLIISIKGKLGLRRSGYVMAAICAAHFSFVYLVVFG